MGRDENPVHRILTSLLYFLSGFAVRNRRKVVFAAWLGQRFSDNPKYLLCYLAQRESGWDWVWIGQESVRRTIPGNLPVRFVRRGSLAAWWETLTAGTIFVTHGYADLGEFNLMRGACRVYLGHGLAIKHMGGKDQGEPLNPFFSAVRRALRQHHGFDRYVASSHAHREKLLIENASCNIAPERLINCGQPRIDFLLENSAPARVAELRARFLARHAIPPTRNVITYLPTFRDKGIPIFSFAALDAARQERLQELLTRLDAVILEKNHFTDILRGATGKCGVSGRVFALSSTDAIDTQELLLITDLLITDYSGCYLDFLVLDRPVLHFAYDRADYERSDRGLYFNLDEVAAGPIVETFEGLCSLIETSVRDPTGHQEARQQVRAKLTEFEHGTACRQLARIVLAIK